MSENYSSEIIALILHFLQANFRFTMILSLLLLKVNQLHKKVYESVCYRFTFSYTVPNFT